MASKAGKSRVGGDVKDLRLQLQDLTRDVINGDLETGRGAVANQLITTQIKLLEYERKSKDLDEMLERLERLEDARRAG
jgi:peptidyl-tRNA hydrolase